MEIIQILAIIFAVFVITRVFLRFKDKTIKGGEFIFWSGLWIALLIVAFIPQVTSFFSRMLGIGRGIDFAVYLSIILLFYLIFRFYGRFEKTEQNITHLVREIAYLKENMKKEETKGKNKKLQDSSNKK